MDFESLKKKFTEDYSFDLDKIIDDAYLDMQVRTIKGHNSSIKEKCFNYLKKEFEKILKDQSCLENFDDTHKKLCEGFLKTLNDKANNIEDQQYGKAQKVINITFKFLVAHGKLDPKYAEKCHMPIDSFVLNWLYGSDKYNNERAWSYITQKDYEEIQAKIDETINEEFKICGIPIKVNNRIEADFYVWYITKTQRSYNNTLNAIKYLSKQINDFDSECIDKKVINNLINETTELSKKLNKIKT